MKFPLVLAFWAMASLAAEKSLVVEAGDFDRKETVARFILPDGWEAPTFLTADGGGSAVQAEGREIWFVVRNLPRGEKRTYRFASGKTSETAKCLGEPDRLTLSVSGKTALVYRTEKTELPPGRPDLKPIFRRGGYIHPVLSPSGKQVTDDYPSNHKHHHGIWFAWTHTEFEGRKPDFWNMGDGKGTVEFAGLETSWSGPVHAGFRSLHQQVDLTSGQPKVALNENWQVRLFAVGIAEARPCFVFDLEVTGRCAGNSPLDLPEYRYGGLGVRGNWAWNGKDKLAFLNSEGVTDRSKGEKGETRGRWAHLGGALDGGFSGMAVLGHPGNPYSPEPQRIHPTEPFLNFAPQQAGALQIAPEKPLTLRYRLVVADGVPDRAELDRFWNDYAHPPRVILP